MSGPTTSRTCTARIVATTTGWSSALGSQVGDDHGAEDQIGPCDSYGGTAPPNDPDGGEAEQAVAAGQKENDVPSAGPAPDLEDVAQVIAGNRIAI